MDFSRRAVSLAAASIVVLAPSARAFAQTPSTSAYRLNRPASAVGFTISGSNLFKFKREGQFNEFTGQLSYDPRTPASAQVDLTVYTSSIDIHDAGHNQLLKSGAFFDVEHFPTMHFSGTATGIRSDGTSWMTGDMTIRGITRRMTIPVKLRQGPQPGGLAGAMFESTFEIDRTKFGLNGTPKAAGFNVSISKNVQIRVAIAVISSSPSQSGP
jgi:polyisoprenoid-binding protein YceI